MLTFPIVATAAPATREMNSAFYIADDDSTDSKCIPPQCTINPQCITNNNFSPAVPWSYREPKRVCTPEKTLPSSEDDITDTFMENINTRHRKLSPPRDWFNELTMIRHASVDEDDPSLFLATNRSFRLRRLSDDHLHMEYMRLLNVQSASALLQNLESQVRYLPPELSQVKIRGEWRNIPREVVAYGDEDHLTREFSGTSISAQPWLSMLATLRNAVAQRLGHMFNFAIVNRFVDGKCGIGTHKEGQPPHDSPLVIVTLGSRRNITFTREHARSRGVDPLRVQMYHGSCLVVKPPTPANWYLEFPKDQFNKGVAIAIIFQNVSDRPQPPSM